MSGKKIKIVLIYAGIGGKGFNSVGQGMDSGWISHGLASLSAAIKSQGFKVELIDLRTLRGWKHFRDEIDLRKPDIVGVTMMSSDYTYAMRSLEIARQVNPHIITAAGGPHPTLMIDEVRDDSKINHIFLGEGEITFPLFLKKIARGEKVERIIPSIPPTLDELPYIDHDFFLHEWRRAGYSLNSPEVPFCPQLKPPFVTIIAGRGCIYNCSFCQPAERILFGRGVRRRSVDNIIGELKELREKYHFKSFMFHDDCLTEDQEWVKAFCDSYKANGFTQSFFCQSRADLVVKNEDMIRRMAHVGLCGLFIGFESGSERVLRFLEQEIGLQDLRTHIDVLEIFTPQDFQCKNNAHLGS
ncbi:MAG: B12-binding domain-containing radical SAM protein, partial [bacterium]